MVLSCWEARRAGFVGQRNRRGDDKYKVGGTILIQGPTSEVTQVSGNKLQAGVQNWTWVDQLSPSGTAAASGACLGPPGKELPLSAKQNSNIKYPGPA